MKYFYYLLLALTCFACKKKEVYTVINQLDFDPQLRVTQQVNDSTITISWNQYTGPDFQSYGLTYYSTTFFGSNAEYIPVWHKEITSVSELSCLVEKMPKNRHHFFDLRVNLHTTRMGYMDTLTHIRTDQGLPLYVTDAQIDTVRHLLYLMDGPKGRIIKVDYQTGQKLAAITLPSELGMCALGSYNGILNELYAPTRDGFIFILDTRTLAIKERIYTIMPYPQVVAAVDGKFYVNSTFPQKDVYTYEHPFTQYTRATMEMRELAMLQFNTRVWPLEGGDYPRFIGIRIHEDYPPIRLDAYSSNYPHHTLVKNLVPDIYKHFPDGQRFISGAEGIIFNTLFQVEHNLPGDKYGSFEIGDNMQTVYASRADDGKIFAFSIPSLQQKHEFNTRLPAFRIFTSGRQLICITRTGIYSRTPHSLIEKIDLP